MIHQQAAYIADDGTEMLEVAPHCYINRCVFEKKRHNWTREAMRVRCLNCGRTAVEYSGG
jgi:ribosomal protein S27E